MQPPQGPYNQQNPFPGYAPQQGPQWTQRPLPNQQQGNNGFMPGQVPPPANIAPDPNQAPAYPYTVPLSSGMPGQMPGSQTAPAGMAGAAPQPVNPGTAGQVPPILGMQTPPAMNAAQANPVQAQEEDPQTAHVVRPGVQTTYQLPQTGIPVPRKQRSKLPYILLALVVLGAVVLVVLRSMAPGQAAYGYVRFGSLSSRHAGDAVVVRSETVFSQEGVSQIDYDADEGAVIHRGENVATIYTSGFSSREWTTLQNYRNQIKEYHKVLIAKASADTRLLSLTTQVRERALEAQRLVQGARGSLSGQETLLEDAMQSLRIYMRQKYPDDQKLSRLYDEENTQLQRISTWSKQYAATTDGLVSFYTDGFETALNMNNYADYTPAQVRSMYNGNVPQQEGQTAVTRNTMDIYRLVRQEPWEVLMLCGREDQDWTPVTGRVYELVIENFDKTIVQATVESFTRSGGELLVRLRIENADALPDVLYIRSCRVRVGESVNTLTVPSRAIYIQNGRKGVVMYTEGGEYWTGVEVVSDDGNAAYVIPENPGVLYDGVPVRLF